MLNSLETAMRWDCICGAGAVTSQLTRRNLWLRTQSRLESGVAAIRQSRFERGAKVGIFSAIFFLSLPSFAWISYLSLLRAKSGTSGNFSATDNSTRDRNGP
jgi:hypothetical protein